MGTGKSSLLESIFTDDSIKTSLFISCRKTLSHSFKQRFNFKSYLDLPKSCPIHNLNEFYIV